MLFVYIYNYETDGWLLNFAQNAPNSFNFRQKSKIFSGLMSRTPPGGHTVPSMLVLTCCARLTRYAPF